MEKTIKTSSNALYKAMVMRTVVMIDGAGKTPPAVAGEGGIVAGVVATSNESAGRELIEQSLETGEKANNYIKQ